MTKSCFWCRCLALVTSGWVSEVSGQRMRGSDLLVRERGSRVLRMLIGHASAIRIMRSRDHRIEAEEWTYNRKGHAVDFAALAQTQFFLSRDSLAPSRALHSDALTQTPIQRSCNRNSSLLPFCCNASVLTQSGRSFRCAL